MFDEREPWPDPCESGCGMLILPPLFSGRWPREGEPIGDLGYAVKGPHTPQRCQELRARHS